MRAALARGLEGLLQVGDAGEHRRQLLEMQVEGAWTRSRAMVVLPVPGGPHRMMEVGPAIGHHAAQRAFGIEQMILPHHFGQAFGPQPVGQGPRRVVCQVAGFEKIAHSRLIARRQQKAPRSGSRGALVSSQSNQLQMPFHADRQVVAGVADLGQAAGIDVMGVLIAIFGEQAGPFRGAVFHPAQGLPAQHGGTAMIADAIVDIGVDRAQAAAAIDARTGVSGIGR